MRVLRLLVLVGASLAVGCDAVPDLYVLDATADVTVATDASMPADASAEKDASRSDASDAADARDAGLDAACTGVSCPDCPPSPGACCPNGVTCYGNNCATDCPQCTCSAGDVCCSKPAGTAPVCRVLPDSGKCS